LVKLVRISTRRDYPLNNFIVNVDLSLVLTNRVWQATFNLYEMQVAWPP
jgi:hypothetical protein